MAFSGKVLVIDDDPDRGGELADLAASAGFTTSLIRSLDSAGAVLGAGSDWDVVLCEMHATPEAWAAEGASLRELDVQVPVMMFSNESRSASMMRALRLGANDFFATPVQDEDALFASMERCVRLRSMGRESPRDASSATQQQQHCAVQQQQQH